VPVAVTAVSSQDLKNGLAQDLSTMSELAPQVSIGQGGSGTGAVITVRGISSGSSDAGVDQSVAVEIDGVPMSRGQIVSTSLFDIAGVQVLQGPQALFFGKNSPAGVVSIRSQDPTDRYEGYVTAGYEFKARQRYIEAAVNTPLTDQFKMRVAFRGSQMDGWMRNIAAPSLQPASIDAANTVVVPGATYHRNFEDNWAGRVGMMYTPSDDFDAKLKIEINNQSRASAGNNLEGFCLAPTTAPILTSVTGVAIQFPGGDCKRDAVIDTGDVPAIYSQNFPNGNGGRPYSLSRYILADLTMNKRFEKFALTSTTGYFYQKIKQLQQSDLNPYTTIYSASNEAYRLFTEELRANSNLDGALNGAVGVYYEHFSRPYFNAPDLFHFFNPVAQNYATVEMDSHTHGDYVSAFGQLRWNITPDLELAGGARWSHDSKHTDITNTAVGPLGATAFALIPVGQHITPDYSNNNVSPEATLTWHPEQNQTLYAAFKTGYKAGGISNPFLVNTSFNATNLKFKPEKAIGFEGGYKADLLNRTLRVDLVGYRYTYKDLQVSSYDVTTISFTLQNAARARVQGFSGSAEWLATEDLTLKGNFGFNDGKYLSFPKATCYSGQTAALGCVGGVQNLAGKALLRAPKFTFTLGADYKLHLGGWDATLSASGSHTGSYNAASDYSPGGYQSAYWIVNAAVRVGPADGKYEFAFIGRNLTNSYYMLQTFGWSGSGNPNQYFAYFNRPREVVLQASARF
jgi:outer membrane receptor protein involved in Fe transport